ncbi:hypothetical protein P170DRAFT_361053, partial [Aspergillus steynii IBT 23096]
YINKIIKRRLAQYINYVITEYRDKIYNIYTQKKAEFQKQVNNSNIKVRITANKYIKEIK